jgi:hypothetical protein
MKGDKQSPFAFRDLLDFQLRSTVMHRDGQLTLKAGPRPNTFQLSAPGIVDALPLRDKRFLRFTMTLILAETKDGTRLKVEDASYQYQNDKHGEQWIFRYDYQRAPENQHPPSHLHVRGAFVENGCLPGKKLLEDVHFPMLRTSFESVIRLLHEQFGVECNTHRSFWRPLLALSERLFLDIAHKPLSGPDSQRT